MCSHVTKQMCQRRICSVLRRSAAVIHPFGWSGLQYGQLIPPGRKDESPTLLCGHRGSSDLCQGSSSPCIQDKENFSLNHQDYCCCRGFKSGNPNVAFSGSVKESENFETRELTIQRLNKQKCI